MRIETFSYHSGQEVFFSFGERYGVFSGVVLGTALTTTGTIAQIEREWLNFFQKNGWEVLSSPLQTKSANACVLLQSQRACIGMAFTTGKSVHEILLTFQGLFLNDQIDVGILCVAGEQLFARIKADLVWLRPVVTVPLWVVALK